MRQRLKEAMDRARRRHQSAERVFATVYARAAWEGRIESFYSGSGSDEELAVPYADAIAAELGDIAPDEMIVDLGCGDFRVGRLLLERLPASYTGVDVVPALIRHNRERFASDRIQFEHRDIAQDAIPVGDYCLVRQVFQHLSNAQVLRTLEKLRSFKRVFVTEHYPTDELHVIPNLDKIQGPDVRAPKSALYFDQPPFGLMTRELLSLPWLPRESRAAAPAAVIKTFEINWPD